MSLLKINKYLNDIVLSKFYSLARNEISSHTEKNDTPLDYLLSIILLEYTVYRKH